MPVGDDVVPAAAHRSPAGTADQISRPEHYTRAWIAEQRERYSAVLSDLAASGPQIFAQDPLFVRTEAPRGRIDGATVAAHRAWLARGRSGPGRLEVVTSDAAGVKLDREWLIAARLVGVNLMQASLHGALLDDSELVDVDLRATVLVQSVWLGAKLHGCWLDVADLRGAWLKGIEATNCSFTEVQFTESSCDDARFVGTDFRSSRFTRASLRGAVFDDCDLGGVDLEGCDLEGASFVRCRFRDMVGRPASIARVTLIDPDISPAGDGSDIATQDELLAYWR
ncbi:MAG: pentapeptide repeat-containing protein [Deltaproteobacteria bacterium]|nr:pentapeptide repeat-containing protein [Deltaproteobacteria bacterium]